MLLRLLRAYLRPYRKLLVAVVLLQAVTVGAALWLPSLNADIIDIGVRNGDTGYIWRHGAWMLAVSAVQIVFAIAAVYYGSKASMAFGRDVRSALFRQVTDFSAREVAEFGAPSLIDPLRVGVRAAVHQRYLGAHADGDDRWVDDVQHVRHPGRAGPHLLRAPQPDRSPRPPPAS